ncbi:MAG TPA: Re/Si-specific NAD(P)(+) transhydrogenase subunit alpha [Pyrinomonadaceae bacterium]|jgi:NAD(P) transhydrogenase subunit alpha|nr:Re/Si-specific NAD(P)(+) transhydrogenase subunit alpha [Pyrinomonadaceae bacterium]
MNIAVFRETQAGEARVALVPESVRKLVALKASVSVESGAGLQAGASDADYEAAGASVSSDRALLLSTADVLAVVNRPSPEDIGKLKKDAVVLGFLRPLDEPAALEAIVTHKLTAFAMELVPRITRAQAMDALSSMATVVGYKAVLMAADHIPRMFPMLMTAAGTVPPARVLVLGAGVAGLQAIATARRLGAVVEAYDVRKAAGEQVRSLGAQFLEVDLGGIKTEDAGGYAVELTEEAMSRGRDLIAKHAKTADVIITTAQVPGRRAPLLVTEEAVSGMKRGAVIVDLAGATGGNCALSSPGETIERDGVYIMSPLNLAATVPVHASQLYSRNVTSFLSLLIKDGELSVDMTDDVVGPSCVTHRGEYVHPRVAAALEELASQ